MGSLLPNPALARAPCKCKNRISRMRLASLLLAISFFALLFHLAPSSYELRGPAVAGLIQDFEHPTVLDSLHLAPSRAFLYVASYDGSITTLKLNNGNDLEPVALTQGCAASPSWLTLDAANSVLYCTDEGLSSASRDGSISSFRTTEDGSLIRLDQTRTISGPVSLVTYGKNRGAIAVAHYGGSALTTWNVKTPNAITPLETRLFKLGQPGPNPARQEVPHPHEVFVDPTGQFILVPDLGADLIRVYAINDEDLTLHERHPLAVAPGSGPRHIAFANKGKKTFMYLVTELGNTVLGFEVAYTNDSLSFEQIWSSGIHGKDKAVPEGAAASEIVVSPDSNFLILSSRNESNLEIPNFDPSNSTRIVSDPLINFSIDPKTGHLNLVQELPCGGRFPRQFSMNKAGTLVAVALQSDGSVALIERDVKTGQLGDFVAYAEIEGEVTAVIFDE